MSARELLLSSLYAAAGVTPETIAHTGTSVQPAEDRRGSGLAVFYQFSNHTMIWCDPDAAPVVQSLEGPEPTLEADVRSFASDGAYEIVGGSVMKTMGDFVRHSVPTDQSFHIFDWNDPTDVARMQRLVDVSSEDDLDESEVAMDDLDDVAVGLLDTDGEVCAYASMRPFDYEPTLGDIGVIVHENHRGMGLGAAVVALLVERALPEGWSPLYRCDPWDNPGSDRLSARVGFEPVTNLLAIRAVLTDA